jgi:hypothetical protein
MPTKGQKKIQVKRIVEISVNENYPRGHYNLVAWFNPPYWGWNGMYLSTPWRI